MREETLTSVEEHLADILATIRPLAPTELSVGDAYGLVLAEDVTAASPLPSFDNSAMDGYAVRVQDVAAAAQDNPVTLPVVAVTAFARGEDVSCAKAAGFNHHLSKPVDPNELCATAREVIRLHHERTSAGSGM